MIDKQELMKKLRTHCPIDPLKESSRISQMKLAKLIYAYIMIYVGIGKFETSGSL